MNIAIPNERKLEKYILYFALITMYFHLLNKEMENYKKMVLFNEVEP